MGLTVLTLAACSADRGTSLENSEISEHVKGCQSEAQGIVNGTEINAPDPDSKRAVLLLIQSGETITSCTGVVISNRVILTAGHCVKGAKKTGIIAVFNTEMTCSPGFNASKSITSVDILTHEDYKGDSRAKDDLAMVKLESPIPASYRPQELYDGQSPLSSDDVLMIGYGITSEGKSDSLRLRKTIKSFKNEAAQKDQNIGFDQRTASGGVCTGDSGGPVYVQVGGQFKLIGVNSIVMGKSNETACHTMSMAMYMPAFADWVEKGLAKLGK